MPGGPLGFMRLIRVGILHAGTASFYHLAVIALFLLFIQLVLIFVVNFNLFASFVCALCCLYNFVTGVCNSGIETDQVD